MKKNITIAIFIYLFFMFLVYSGLFRNYSNPLVVARYYLDCLRNREGFLTYQISKFEFFDEDKLGDIFKKYKMNDIQKIVFGLKELKNNHAHVEAKIFYKNKEVNNLIVELEKSDNLWLVSALR